MAANVPGQPYQTRPIIDVANQPDLQGHRNRTTADPVRSGHLLDHIGQLGSRIFARFCG